MSQKIASKKKNMHIEDAQKNKQIGTSRINQILNQTINTVGSDLGLPLKNYQKSFQIEDLLASCRQRVNGVNESFEIEKNRGECLIRTDYLLYRLIRYDMWWCAVCGRRWRVEMLDDGIATAALYRGSVVEPVVGLKVRFRSQLNHIHIALSSAAKR